MVKIERLTEKSSDCLHEGETIDAAVLCSVCRRRGELLSQLGLPAPSGAHIVNRIVHDRRAVASEHGSLDLRGFTRLLGASA